MHFLRNPWLWTVASFLFGGIFAGDLRRFLRALLFGGRHRFVKFRRDSALAKLRQLERVHGNTYELIRYLGEQGTWLGLTAFLFLGQIYMTSVPSFARLIPDHHHVAAQNSRPQGSSGPSSHQEERDPAALIMVAAMYSYLALSIGRLIEMFGFLRALKEFSIVKTKLAKRVQKFDHRLGEAGSTQREGGSALSPA